MKFTTTTTLLTLVTVPAVMAAGNGNGGGNGGGNGNGGGGGGGDAASTCSPSLLIPNPPPANLPAGPRCCEGFFDAGTKYGQCETSSCPNNFGEQNLNCFNFGSPQFSSVSNPTAPAGSANCPYMQSDQAICDVSYYTQLNNGLNCRLNPSGNNGNTHCLGRVKCGSTGIVFPSGPGNPHSYGTDSQGFGGTVSYGSCNMAATAAGLGAGTICFYNGFSENWKVCDGDPGPDVMGDPHLKVSLLLQSVRFFFTVHQSLLTLSFRLGVENGLTTTECAISS